jgi:beta-glucosidase
LIAHLRLHLYFLDAIELELALDPVITYTEGLFTDYMYFDEKSITPRFEFGYGLSYSFLTVYSLLSVTNTGTNAYTISATIMNVGTLAGTEIAQLYLGFPAGSGEPPKLLRGFEAVALGAWQSEEVTFNLLPKDLM